MHIKYLAGPILIVFGGVNVISETSSPFGWIALIVGPLILAKHLSGTAKPRKYGHGDSGEPNYTGDHPSYSDSDSFGGGDGGGD
jgi:hypothetical protein